jgi:hypothetical protein
MKLPARKRARPVQTDPKQVEERRKALKTIAKVGLYTPPALLALLKSSRAKSLSG